MSCCDQDLLTLLEPVIRQRQKSKGKLSSKRVRCRAQDSHIVISIHNHYRGPNKLRRSCGLAKQNIGLTSVELTQNMRRSQEVALFVDKKTVPVEKIVIAPG